jgi:hypothetical protein
MSEYKNKSIAFVINSLEGGGAERVMCNLLRTMQSTFNENNYKVYLVLLDKLPELQQCPDYVEKVTLHNKGKLLSSYFQCKQWVKHNSPDLLVSFLTRSNIVSTLIGKRVDIPKVSRKNILSRYS